MGVSHCYLARLRVVGVGVGVGVGGSNDGSDINSPEREIRLVQDDEWRPTVHNLPTSSNPTSRSIFATQAVPV